MVTCDYCSDPQKPDQFITGVFRGNLRPSAHELNFFPFHAYLLAEAVVPILEMVQLEEIATEKLYEFAFFGACIKLRGATGAPMRPVVMPMNWSASHSAATANSAGGLSEQTVGLVTLPMSIAAAISSLAGTRMKSIRMLFLISIGSGLIGCICLLLVSSETPVWLIAITMIFFSAPQGMFFTANQAAVYVQAPAEEIGTAAGFQRTAQYVGAIAATSLLGLLYGQHATDGGLHALALVMCVISVPLFVATIFDRTIPRPASA